jgi:PQQ-like domain
VAARLAAVLTLAVLGLGAGAIPAVGVGAGGGDAAAGAPSYRLLIADHRNRRLLITDFDGNLVWKFDNPTGGTGASGPLGVRWMPNNQILATFGTGEVGLIDVATKTWVWRTKGFNRDWFQSPYDAELLPDGNLAVATRFNEGGRVAVYNRTTGAVVWKHLLPEVHAVHFRTAEQSYNSPYPTLLMGGWGSVQEVEYRPGQPAAVAWSAPTEYTHEVLVVENDQLLTTEGYYIQKIDRLGHQLWRQDTPAENRRIAVNPFGGYIYTVGNGNRIEFRDVNGGLVRKWSTLSDGSTLNYPYGLQVIPPDGQPAGVPPGGSPGGPPGSEAPPSSTNASSIPGAPSTVTSEASPPRVPRMTKARAARLVRKALARRYGRLLRHRRISVRSCRLARDRRSARCRVRWQASGSVYSGFVTVAYRIRGGRVVQASRVDIRRRRR